MECSAWRQQQSTLHVQSVSRWAPSNIGPYSQAKTLGGSIVFVSGQIALDPSTMTILGDTAPAQAEQCVRNLEVADVKRAAACAGAEARHLFVYCPGLDPARARELTR